MNKQTLANLCEQIYHRFPELAGSSPKVQNRPGEQQLITFRGSAKTADGRTLPRVVRVVAGADGKIIKITTSR